MNGRRRRRRSINDHMQDLIRFIRLLTLMVLYGFILYVTIRLGIYLVARLF